jgi:molybdate transport system ATP-binding protein
MELFVDIKKKLADFTLEINFGADAKTTGLIGASGSGKSMTLKCIAGIEKPDSGKIILNDRTLFDSEKGINMPSRQRKVGYLFQN